MRKCQVVSTMYLAAIALALPMDYGHKEDALANNWIQLLRQVNRVNLNGFYTFESLDHEGSYRAETTASELFGRQLPALNRRHPEKSHFAWGLAVRGSFGSGPHSPGYPEHLGNFISTTLKPNTTMKPSGNQDSKPKPVVNPGPLTPNPFSNSPFGNFDTM